MTFVSKHLSECQRLGEMSSSLALNHKNYLHFIFLTFFLKKRLVEPRQLFFLPFSDRKVISFIFQRYDRKMKMELKRFFQEISLRDPAMLSHSSHSRNTIATRFKYLCPEK